MGARAGFKINTDINALAVMAKALNAKVNMADTSWLCTSIHIIIYLTKDH